MENTDKRRFGRLQLVIVGLGLALLFSLPAIKLSVLSVEVAFARQQHHGLTEQAAVITRTEVGSGRAAAQDGGYQTSGPCTLHLLTEQETDKKVLMPCATFTRFEQGERVTLSLAPDKHTVVEVAPAASDGIETSWGWNGLWGVYAVVPATFLVAAIFYCLAWLVRYRLKRQRMRIGFAVAVATLVYLAIAFAQCLWPQFYRESANPMWPLLAAGWSTAAFVALLVYGHWQAKPYRKSLKKRG